MAKSFHELSPRSQTIIFVALSAVTLVAAWQVLLGPAHAELATERARLAAVQGEVARAQATAAKLPQLRRDVQLIEAQLLETTAILPDEKDPQDVLRNLNQVASEAMLSIATFTPKPILTKTQYSEWPISLALEGSYHDLGRFFDRIASMPRLMSVADLEIKVNPKPQARSTITATCVATTFVFKKDIAPEAAAGAPASGGAAAGAAGGKQ
jgi:type IV pilus assembly protein PilO